jgi:hypothetical protein
VDQFAIVVKTAAREGARAVFQRSVTTWLARRAAS